LNTGENCVAFTAGHRLINQERHRIDIDDFQPDIVPSFFELLDARRRRDGTVHFECDRPIGTEPDKRYIAIFVALKGSDAIVIITITENVKQPIKFMEPQQPTFAFVTDGGGRTLDRHVRARIVCRITIARIDRARITVIAIRHSSLDAGASLADALFKLQAHLYAAAGITVIALGIVLTTGEAIVDRLAARSTFAGRQACFTERKNTSFSTIAE
jgi:hypothetical protein